MRRTAAIFLSWIILGVTIISATSTWNFHEAIISVIGKGGSSKAFKDKLSDHVALANPIVLGAADTLRIIITTTEDGIARRPHQTFLLLRDQDTGLEAAFPFTVKANGKGRVEFSQKELPIQFKIASQPLRATILIASFGSSQPFSNHVFNLDIKHDPHISLPKYEKPLRYGKLDQINHIFSPDPKSGPLTISIFFTLLISTCVPLLISSWVYTGANFEHLPKALRAAPVAHILYFLSILAMEYLLFMYYYNWTLFQVLPVAGFISLITIFSGPEALSEVQSRRLAGER